MLRNNPALSFNDIDSMFKNDSGINAKNSIKEISQKHISKLLATQLSTMLNVKPQDKKL